MESTKRRLADDAIQLRGGTGDIKRLKRDGAASAEELREFVSGLHGKSPQEVLGLVAESGLFQATAVATIGIAVVLVAFTVVPYLFKGAAPEKTTAKTAAKQPAAAAQAAAQSSAAAPAGTGASADGLQPSADDLKTASAVLGLDETKAADPKANPLDKKLDGLLDGIDK